MQCEMEDHKLDIRPKIMKKNRLTLTLWLVSSKGRNVENYTEKSRNATGIRGRTT